MAGNKKKRNRKKASSPGSPGAAPGAAPSHPDDGHGHQHGHGHSHDGQPCGGHASQRPRPAERESDEIREAKHYVDVLRHFQNYSECCRQKFAKHVMDFSAIDPALSALVPGFGPKHKRILSAVDTNAAFVARILDAKECFMSPGVNYHRLLQEPFVPSGERQSKVRSTLRQCVRDWSAEGAEERAQCYSPILQELERLYPDTAARGAVRVCVPGSGLGRLVWEVASRGFTSQGNEFSYFMLLCSYVILNTMSAVEETKLYPFIFDSKNLYKAEDQFREILIPDVDPNTLPPNSGFSMVAGDFLEVFRDPSSWDVLATCFFLDTANNVLDYIRAIAHMLKVGGHWINFGPLLYHFADMPNEVSVELAWDEIRATLPAFGLKLLKEEQNLESAYTGNRTSMLHTRYSCLFFVCVKEAECPIPQGPAHRADSSDSEDPQEEGGHAHDGR